MRFSRLCTLGLAVLPALVAQAAPPSRPDIRGVRPLSVKIETSSWYAKEDALTLTFSLTNPNTFPVWVLRWNLPTGRMDADLFEVVKDGAGAAYQGRIVKRAAPRAGDYVEIKAGETFTVEMDPSAFYDMEDQGNYTIRYRLAEIPLRTENPATAASPMFMDVAGEVLPTHEAGLNHGAQGQFFFAGVPAEANSKLTAQPTDTLVGGSTGCTTAQKTKLSTAHANAKTMVSKAQTYLANNTNGGTLYKTWFGTYTASRLSTIKTHYANLYSTYATKTVTFDCSCTDSSYAYVYPSQPYKIYLCGAFWSAGATGRDSQAGTLVHETSHFTVVAGTQDYVYGASGAKSLAISTPTKAIMNADNHEYFAEDQ